MVVRFAGKALEQLVEAPDRVRLHAELHARLHGELARKTVASLGDRGEIAFVIHVDGRLPLDDRCAAGVGAVLVPVGTDLKVHMVGEADLVDAALNGEGADVVHGKDGVVGEFGVHVVVGEHGGPIFRVKSASRAAGFGRIGRQDAARDADLRAGMPPMAVSRPRQALEAGAGCSYSARMIPRLQRHHGAVRALQ